MIRAFIILALLATTASQADTYYPILPNSCAMFLLATKADGSKTTAICSAVAQDSKTILTSYNCSAPALDFYSMKAKYQKLQPVAIGCGYKGPQWQPVCAMSEHRDLAEVQNCIQQNFNFGYVFDANNFKVDRPDMGLAESFVTKYKVPVNTSDTYRRSFLASVLSMDISAIRLAQPLTTYNKGARLLPLGFIKEYWEGQTYTDCRVEGFGSMGFKREEEIAAKEEAAKHPEVKRPKYTPRKEIFFGKSQHLNGTDLIFQGPMEHLGSAAAAQEDEITELMGKIQIVTDFPEHSKFASDDAGAPLYCTKDGNSWDLVALVSQSGVFSSFISKPVADLVGNGFRDYGKDPLASTALCDYTIKPASITLKHQFDTQFQDDSTNEIYVELNSIGQYKSYRALSNINIEEKEVGKVMKLCPGGKKCTPLVLRQQQEGYASFSLRVFERDDFYLRSASDADLQKVDPIAISLVTFKDCASDADKKANIKRECGSYNAPYNYWVNTVIGIERVCR